MTTVDDMTRAVKFRGADAGAVERVMQLQHSYQKE